MTQVINLTPHPITIVGQTGETLRVYPKAETPARVTVKTVPAEPLADGTPTVRTEFGTVQDLPEPTENTFFIVSQIVKSACLDRQDLLVPAELFRDGNGTILGCKSLSR
jgi:hypothetical protein